MCCRNGDRYAGEYFGDKVHGFGIYHFANGHCYEGSWHEGQRQGYGTYSFRNSEAKCGEWDAGTLKHPLSPLSDVVLQVVEVPTFTFHLVFSPSIYQNSNYCYESFEDHSDHVCAKCRHQERQQGML